MDKSTSLAKKGGLRRKHGAMVKGAAEKDKPATKSSMEDCVSCTGGYEDMQLKYK